MTVVRELITRLGYKLDESQLKKAEASFGKLAKLAAGVTAAFSAKAIYDRMEKAVLDVADLGMETQKAAIKIGIGTEAVQELGFAAEDTGVGTDALRTGLRFLQKNAVAASKGNLELAKSFGGIGVAVTSGGKIKAADSLLAEIASKISGIKDPAVRTATAIKLFGRAGAGLLPLLSLGGEGIDKLREKAYELGGVLTDLEIKAAAKFKIKLFELKYATNALWNKLGLALIPSITRLVDRQLAWISSSKGLRDGIKSVGQAADWLVDKWIRFSDFLLSHANFLKFFAVSILGPLALALTKTALAGALAAFWPIAAAAAYLAFGAVVGAVAEDIYAYVSGNESALGNLYDALVKKGVRPEDTWYYKALYYTVVASHDAISAASQFFDGFFRDLEEHKNKWGATLKDMFKVAIVYWKGDIEEFFVWLAQKLLNLGPSIGKAFTLGLNPAQAITQAVLPSNVPQAAISGARNVYNDIRVEPKTEVNINGSGVLGSIANPVGVVQRAVQSANDDLIDLFRTVANKVIK